MKFQPTPYQIISTLDSLGLKHENEPNHKGWVSIQCPNPTHYEETHDNCSINLNSGFVKCFSCGYGNKGESRKSIVNVVMDRLNYDYKQAIQFIEQGLGYSGSVYVPPVQSQKPKKKRERSLYNFTMMDIDPEQYYYTQQRGFTKEFIETFNIKLAVSNWYEDYMIIPIIDTEKGINEYEGRKIKEYETLCKFYEIENASYEKLKNNFQQLCKSNIIRLNRKDYKVYIDTEAVNNPTLLYLLKPKTLYISSSRCQETIWNIDNLNYDEDLYVTEGLGSTCKIWSNISKNVSCIFGVSITEEQIKYLKKFKRIIYLPDYDKAGYESVEFLVKYLNNFVVCDIHSEDTDESYVEDIKKAELLNPASYLYKYFTHFKLSLSQHKAN